MPLTDLLRRSLPPGVTCKKYVAGDGKRCAYYLDGGPCIRPDEFMCIEFLKRNPVRPAAAAPPDPRAAALADFRQLRNQLSQTGGAR